MQLWEIKFAQMPNSKNHLKKIQINLLIILQEDLLLLEILTKQYLICNALTIPGIFAFGILKLIQHWILYEMTRDLKLYLKKLIWNNHFSDASPIFSRYDYPLCFQKFIYIRVSIFHLNY